MTKFTPLSPTPHPAQVGTIVTVAFPDSVQRFRLGPADRDLGTMATLSPRSPLGAALVGALPGETVHYRAPGGALSVTVTDVELTR